MSGHTRYSSMANHATLKVKRGQVLLATLAVLLCACGCGDSYAEAWSRNWSPRVGQFEGVKVVYHAAGPDDFIEGVSITVFSYESLTTSPSRWMHGEVPEAQSEQRRLVLSWPEYSPIARWEGLDGEVIDNATASAITNQYLPIVEDALAGTGEPYVLDVVGQRSASVVVLVASQRRVVYLRNVR